MAKHSNADHAPRRRRGSALVWALMAFLILGLGGFGVTNFSGGLTVFGSVGDQELLIEDYIRAMNQERRAFQAQTGQDLSPEQAQALGIEARVRGQLITRAALAEEAAARQVSAGDARVASEVSAMDAFKGLNGFDRDLYAQALRQQGYSEREFETLLRQDLAATLLENAVTGGAVMLEAFVTELATFEGERRDMSLLRLAESDLPSPLPDPTEEELRAYHAAHGADFMRPETKKITTAALLPEELAPTLPVDEDALKALYEERASDFNKPERRLVERLVFPDTGAAEKAMAEIAAGGSFDALVTQRGLTLEDVDLGEVTREDLGAAGEAVFALEGPGVTGPFTSDLGPALFRMNAILAAEETPFETVRDDLAAEYQLEAARRALSEKLDAVDDALAGGAALADLEKEQGLKPGTLDLTATSAEGLAAYPAFRQAAEAAEPGDYPQALLLDDGGLVAFEVTEVLAPAPLSFDEARAAVETALRAEQRQAALKTQAEALLAKVQGGEPLAAQGILRVAKGLTRRGFVDDAPGTLIPQLFAMKAGEVAVIEGEDFVGLLQLDAVTPADLAADPGASEALRAGLSESLRQDLFALYTGALADAAGVTIDPRALEAAQSLGR